MSDGARAYARFRSSKWFLIALALLVAVWIPWNLTPGLPHWDGDDLGRLNLILSLEASLSVALLLMDSAKADQTRSYQLRSLQDHIRQMELANKSLHRKLDAILERTASQKDTTCPQTRKTPR